MQRDYSLRPLIVGGATLALGAMLLLLWPALTQALLWTQGFEPHGSCFLWEPGVLWLHVITDILIGVSYVVIAGILAYLVYQSRRDLPFHWVILAFGAFIIACGGTHFLEVVTLWVPVYWLSGYVKLVTAIASVATALALPPLVPQIRALTDAAKASEARRQQLELANHELTTLYAKVTALDDLKTRFFANVSHELRTPLTLILGPTARLLTEHGLTDGQRRDVEVVDRNARLLRSHVDDLLDIAKIDAGQMGLVATHADLAQLIRAMAANFMSLADERQIRLRVETPATLFAQIDTAKIQRVIMNLLGNAFAFTPAGGQVRCTLSAQHDHALITIADSGPGVPPAFRHVIFERFQQASGGAARQSGGTGLGLSITRELLTLHGGTIAVSDAPEGGASFAVMLPLVALAGTPVSHPAALSAALDDMARTVADVLRPAAPLPASTAAADAPLVLVVEDNPDMRTFIATTLADEFRVATAASGAEGMESALALRPDALLTDMMMPDVNGDALLQMVRQHAELHDMPAIMLTAKADTEHRVWALRNGAQDYLVKPFAAEELRARLANLLAISHTRAILQRELATTREDTVVLATELAARTHDLEHALAHAEATAAENARLYAETQQALKAREAFLQVASHELKTPLTVLLGNAQLIERRAARQGDADLRSRRSMQQIVQQAERLHRMVLMLLDLSRIDQHSLVVERVPLDFGALVQQTVEELQPTLAQHTLDFQREARSFAIVGDVMRLTQVLHNIIGNAVKYSPSGGAIVVNLARQAHMVVLTVTDQGIGIPALALPHVFERFARGTNVDERTFSGMGIGLYVVQAIVAHHGGQVSVASTEGAGTTVTVLLPAAHDV